MAIPPALHDRAEVLSLLCDSVRKIAPDDYVRLSRQGADDGALPFLCIALPDGSDSSDNITVAPGLVACDPAVYRWSSGAAIGPVSALETVAVKVIETLTNREAAR